MIKNSASIIIFILLFLDLIAGAAVYDLSKARFLEVSFFDVGQGDSIFIETPQKHQILIDGGPSSVILEKLGDEMPFWDRTIDLVILTHPEKDHLAGLLDVLERYKVENILWTAIERDTPESKEWVGLAKEEKANIFIVSSGRKIRYDKKPEDYIEILYPFENLAGQKYENSNDTSVVSRLVFGKNSFLFTGDISAGAEKEISGKENIILSAEVLKISHHGSKYSTSEEFLTKVSPKIAVISAGRNNQYGHPHQEVLELLQKYGIRILITSAKGDIKIISDGESLSR